MVVMIINIAKVDIVRHHHQQKQVNCRKKMRGWHFEGFALGPAKSLQVKQTDVGLTVTRATPEPGAGWDFLWFCLPRPRLLAAVLE